MTIFMEFGYRLLPTAASAFHYDRRVVHLIDKILFDILEFCFSVITTNETIGILSIEAGESSLYPFAIDDTVMPSFSLA
tara:strand:+ start:292 stop:528 length:237 start_codon:yes stop_codon:yes gene_type:complete